MSGDDVRTDGGDVTVPAMLQRKVVKLAGGGSVTVRRISRTDKTDLMSVAKLREDDVYTVALYGQLVTRRAVCEIAGLTDDEGKPLKMVREGGFVMADRAIINAMTDAEQASIFAIATERPSEEITGK